MTCKRSPPFACYRSRANHFTIPHADVGVIRPALRFAVNGFLSDIPQNLWLAAARGTHALFGIVEADRLQFGKDCADEDLRFNAKQQSFGII